MKILLKNMRIQNFKGCKDMEIDFGDKTWLKGANATGKTTVFDAFTWLLFNHDSLGSTKFDIRPLDKDGKAVDNVEISVESTILVGEEEYTLKKVQKQKWVKKRGTDTREFQGNVNEFEINGYPKSEKEFKEFLSGIIYENVFNLVTNPNAFTALPWKEQRDILMKFVGEFTDADIASQYGDKYNTIIPELKIASTEDIVKKYSKAKAALNREMVEIPARIDEASKQLVIADVGALEIEKAAKQVELKKVEDELSGGICNLEQVNALREQVMSEKFNLSEFQNKANAELSEKRRTAREASDRAEKEYRDISKQIEDLEYERDSYERQKQEEESRKQRLGEEWKSTKHSTYPEFIHLADYVEPEPLKESDLVCPTCGQDLPENVKDQRIKSHEERVQSEKTEYEAKCKAHKEKYESGKAKFEQEKQEKLEKITADGKQAKANVENFQKIIDERNNVILSLQKQREECKEKFSRLEAEYKAIPKSVDISGREDYKSIIEKISSLEKQIDEMSKESSGRTELDAKKRVIQDEIAEIDGKIKAADNTKVKERIAELEAEQKSVGQKIAEQERMIDLTEDFIRAKMNLISEKINDKFQIVSFKLFDNQINGGLKETCECTVNGVPLSSLNAGHRIVAGLDIIRSVSELYGVKCPIFIDNSESVNEFNIPDIGTQMIFLEVTEDREMIVESEDK